MHTAKVILLVLLTLAVMRAAGWSLGWLLHRYAATRRGSTAVLSNAGAFAIFTAALIQQRMPGEWLDPAGATFGAVVFTLFALADLRWGRWGRSGTERRSQL